MWSYSDDYNIIANLYIRSCYKDGVLKRYEIYPCEGYVLRIPYLDEYKTNDLGDYVLDDNGNPAIVPYRTYGGASEMINYDWQTNPCGYAAENYREGIFDEVVEANTNEATESDYINALKELGVDFNE